jgi:hypothetical protein
VTGGVLFGGEAERVRFLSLVEGDRAGGADYTAVAMAIRRLPPHARRNRSLRDAMRRVAKECAK